MSTDCVCQDIRYFSDTDKRLKCVCCGKLFVIVNGDIIPIEYK